MFFSVQSLRYIELMICFREKFAIVLLTAVSFRNDNSHSIGFCNYYRCWFTCIQRFICMVRKRRRGPIFALFRFRLDTELSIYISSVFVFLVLIYIYIYFLFKNTRQLNSNLKFDCQNRFTRQQLYSVISFWIETRQFY